MIGKSISHYTILRKLGQGGMGEVYLAQDNELGRQVALKFLNEFLQQDEKAGARFLREARSAAALDHPYICSVHEVAEWEGAPFIVMQYVEGQTLEEKLTGGPFSLRDAVRIGSEISEALEKAHQVGIVHRDLKPSNIMLTPQGHVKVMDFGLAKQLRPAEAGDQAETGAASLTQTGVILGTMNYMSPEQLRGQTLDGRSDLFAFGVLLYEILTGVHPFGRKSRGEMVQAILEDIPPPLSRYLEAVPELLEHTVRKMLAKDREQRYQSAHEVRTNLGQLLSPADSTTRPEIRRTPPAARGLRLTLAAVCLVLITGLGWWYFGGSPTAVVSGEINSIAVLPLDNLMNDPEQDYFVDGMHEALITELSRISALKVISRTSTMQYKGVKKALPEIARELGVDGVVEGSVLREGNEVRITVQLIHGPRDRHLWAENYQRELHGILALQKDVAQAIANEIRAKLSPQEHQRLARARAVNPEAYEAYLKGQYYLAKRTEESLKRALHFFEEAVKKESDSALGYAGLADGYNFLSYFQYLAPNEGRSKAKTAALKALKLDPSLAEAHTALARVLAEYDWDWSGAEREFKKAIELNPSYVIAHQYYGLYLSAVGRHNEAIAAGKRALELDPLSLPVRNSLGARFYLARHYDQAVEQLKNTLQLNPNFGMAHWTLGRTYLAKGLVPQAIAELEEGITFFGQNAEFLGYLGSAYALAGRKVEAKKILGQLRQSSGDRYVSPTAVAMIYSDLGERKQALAWLEKAFDDRSLSQGEFMVGPRWDSLRSAPGFKNLVLRMGLEP